MEHTRDPHIAALDSALREAQRGGKRLRPRLVHLVHDSLDGTAGEAVVQVAEAIEQLHTAFVVHDDVIDHDDHRRGRLNTRGSFRAEAAAAGATAAEADTYAVAGAVLTGDLALAAALRSVATAPIPRAIVERLLDLFDHALRVSAAGELADVRYAIGMEEPSLAQVLTMEEHKTAVYSFQLPMQTGAVLAGAPDELVSGLREVGRSLGLAYQLFDDLVGAFGDPADTGKSALGDLREGKRTPLIVHALTTSAWPVVRRYVGDPRLGEAEAEQVRAALEAGGSRAFITDLATGYVDSAVAQGRALGLPVGVLDAIRQLSGQKGRGAA